MMIFICIDSADGSIDAKTLGNHGNVMHKPMGSTDDGKVGGEEVLSQNVPIIVAVMLIVPIMCVLVILLGCKIHNASKY